MLSVSIAQDDGFAEQLVFSDDEVVVVGRGRECGVRIEDPAASRRHLTIARMGDLLKLTDFSTNGTLMGERLLRGEGAIAPFDVPLRIGATVITARAADDLELTPEADDAEPKTVEVDPEVRREAHRRLLDSLNLASNGQSELNAQVLRPKVLSALRNIVRSMPSRLPANVDLDRLVGELANEALGLGPLEELLADPSVSEIMVLDPSTIYVEREGRCALSPLKFTDDDRVRAAIERIVTPLGRRIDESSPMVDARLKDGSRVNAIIRPLALRGSCLTIRKFPKHTLQLDELIQMGSLSGGMGRFLSLAVRARKNVIVSGGTGSGKTTLLNLLSASIPEHERIVTIEDSAELRLQQPHVVSLETRPPNLEGTGACTIRDLVRNALRMRPDRIVVGECRSGEALDMLQAMNTGHEGSMTTLHANSPSESLARLETLCLMAGVDLPVRAIREQIAQTLHLIVQQQRLPDGSRKIVEIAELDGLDRAGRIRLRPLFKFRPGETAPNGKIVGRFGTTGYLPSFTGELVRRGFIARGEGLL